MSKNIPYKANKVGKKKDIFRSEIITCYDLIEIICKAIVKAEKFLLILT